ncbi:Smc5-6 complex SMC subunit Smc6 [Ceratobasidium sp. AG-Ba]|nr:Smc5-6 complex SMC subunit Smc6 [Ceratobasidium sp. AG-Ba]QRW10848.1 Smc5-6 complex SMC subunit Smc6 [Ceratobasidium sp. AG-Ba]
MSRNAGDMDGAGSSSQLERANPTSPASPSGATPRKSKRTRIISPPSLSFRDNILDDSASSPDEEFSYIQLTEPQSMEQETEPESSIPRHIRRLTKGKQVERQSSSSSGFINMTSHRQSLPADSDTDESSFWSAGDTSLSSNSSTLPSDTSISVQMDVVRFDWPGSTIYKRPSGRHSDASGREADCHKVHRIRSAPNLSPDRFISRHSVEDDNVLHRSTKSTPRSVRLARHLGFVIGDGLPLPSPAEKFEERLKQAQRQLESIPADDSVEASTSFTQRVIAAGARTESKQTSAHPSTRLGSPSTRPVDFGQHTNGSTDPVELVPHSTTRRDASPNPFHLRHAASSESILHHSASRLSLNPSRSLQLPNSDTLSKSPIPTVSTNRPSLRQLPHEHALLLLSSSSGLPHTLTVGASGAAMSLGMSTPGKRKATSGKPSPSSRYHMQRAPIHVYDAPEILEDYYASPFAWNHPTQDPAATLYPGAGIHSSLGSGSSSSPSSGNRVDGMLACALGASVFFSRVSGSRLLCIERLCTTDPLFGMQSAVEWGTQAGGWDHALAVGRTRGGLSVWDVRTKQHILDLRQSTLVDQAVSLHPNSPSPSQVCAISWNRNLIAAGLNGSSLLWDLRCAPRLSGTGESGPKGEAMKLGAHGVHKVCGVKWREDGEMLATGGDDNVVCIWDVRMPRRPVVSSEESHEQGRSSTTLVGQTPMWKKRMHTGAVKALAWCPWAPNILASGGGKQDGTVCFWNTQTGTLKDTLPLGSQITSIAFSPVCREFVTTHGFRSTSLSTPTSPPNPIPPAPPRFQTYDPQPPSDPDIPPPPLQDTANSIVTHTYPSLARVAHVPNLHGMRISHASLSPDGSRLMTGGTFEALVMWSVWGVVGKEADEGIGSAIGLIR